MKDPVYYIGDESDNIVIESALGQEGQGRFIYTVYEVERDTAERLRVLLQKIKKRELEDLIDSFKRTGVEEHIVIFHPSQESLQLTKQYAELKPAAAAGFFVTNRTINQVGLIIEKGLLPNLSKTTAAAIKAKLKS